MNKKIRLGDLNTQIEILEEMKTTSSTGSVETESNVFKKVWANQIDIAGHEDEEGKVRVLFDATFIIKYNKELSKTKINAMRVKDAEGYLYNIVSVIEIEQKRYLRINTIRRE